MDKTSVDSIDKIGMEYQRTFAKLAGVRGLRGWARVIDLEFSRFWQSLNNKSPRTRSLIRSICLGYLASGASPRQGWDILLHEFTTPADRRDAVKRLKAERGE